MLKILLWRNFRVRPKRVLLTIMAIIMGSSLISLMLGASAEMDKKIGLTLKSYGANLVILPRNGDFLKEDPLLKIKTIFWRHNLVGIAPLLYGEIKIPGKINKVKLIGTWFDRRLKTAEGNRVKTGAKQTFPWWRVKGNWPRDKKSILIGASLAKKLNVKISDKILVKGRENQFEFKVAGILYSSDYDSAILGQTTAVQSLINRPNVVNEVKINTLIVPELKLAPAIRNKKVSQMSREEYLIWYCTPTVGAISTQIKEVIPKARVKNLRQFTEAQGSLLSQIELVIMFIIVVSSAATILAVMTSTATAVIERRAEIGLAKAIGASNRQIAVQFMAELGLMSMIGGVIGYLIGIILAQLIGKKVFGTAISFNPFTLMIALSISLTIVLLGGVQPINKATKIQPIKAIRG